MGIATTGVLHGTSTPPAFDPAEWAATCRNAFAKRRPYLIDQVWDDVYTGVPWGMSVWVVALKRIDQVGSILLPDRAVGVRCEGWVVSVGPDVTRFYDNARGSMPYANPFELVGRRVFWGAYCGIQLEPAEPFIDPATTPPRNIPYPRQYLSISVGDIIGESLREDGEILPRPEEVEPPRITQVERAPLALP